jgi:hypothetical protein
MDLKLSTVRFRITNVLAHKNNSLNDKNHKVIDLQMVHRIKPWKERLRRNKRMPDDNNKQKKKKSLFFYYILTCLTMKEKNMIRVKLGVLHAHNYITHAIFKDLSIIS